MTVLTVEYTPDVLRSIAATFRASEVQPPCASLRLYPAPQRGPDAIRPGGCTPIHETDATLPSPIQLTSVGVPSRVQTTPGPDAPGLGGFSFTERA
jgi:hypothetical protein